MSEKVNPLIKSVPYQIGRMMAVYAAIQRDALGDVNAGVVERYYGAAITAPAMVLGQLSKLCTHHLSKMENQKYAMSFRKRLQAIAMNITETPPATLTLEEQGQFALGYYQENADIYARKESRAAAKSDNTKRGGESMSISNRYEFLFFIQCVDGNPNGDPDMGNMPRVDPQNMNGLITDVAIKRRIRNYIAAAYDGRPGMDIIVRSATNINKYIAKAVTESGGDPKKKDKQQVGKARAWACQNFYDVRTFGAVLSTGANAGQVRGPVQLTFARSLDAILPLDISITRMAKAENVPGAVTYEDYQKWEDQQEEDSLRTDGSQAADLLRPVRGSWLCQRQSGGRQERHRLWRGRSQGVV